MNGGLAGRSEAAVTRCLSESVIKAHAPRVKARRAVAQADTIGGVGPGRFVLAPTVPAKEIAHEQSRTSPVAGATIHGRRPIPLRGRN